MKIRFEDQLITYRLSPEEAEKLKIQKYLCTRTNLPNGKFHYKIRLETDQPEFKCEGNRAELNIPFADFENYKPTKKGLCYEFKTDSGTLTLAVEIDLKKLRQK